MAMGQVAPILVAMVVAAAVAVVEVLPVRILEVSVVAMAEIIVRVLVLGQAARAALMELQGQTAVVEVAVEAQRMAPVVVLEPTLPGPSELAVAAVPAE